MWARSAQPQTGHFSRTKAGSSDPVRTKGYGTSVRKLSQEITQQNKEQLKLNKNAKYGNYLPPNVPQEITFESQKDIPPPKLPATPITQETCTKWTNSLLASLPLATRKLYELLQQDPPTCMDIIDKYSLQRFTYDFLANYTKAPSANPVQPKQWNMDSCGSARAPTYKDNKATQDKENNSWNIPQLIEAFKAYNPKEYSKNLFPESPTDKPTESRKAVSKYLARYQNYQAIPATLYDITSTAPTETKTQTNNTVRRKINYPRRQR